MVSRKFEVVCIVSVDKNNDITETELEIHIQEQLITKGVIQEVINVMVSEKYEGD